MIDNLLTPPALLALRRYLLESTIWHDFGYIDRFVASYLEDGLACPLLLQIADELRKRIAGPFGAIFRSLRRGPSKVLRPARQSTLMPMTPPSRSISG